jgi:hypothetical protein
MAEREIRDRVQRLSWKQFYTLFQNLSVFPNEEHKSRESIPSSQTRFSLYSTVLIVCHLSREIFFSGYILGYIVWRFDTE